MHKPSVGMAVHYVSYGTTKGEFTSQCRAADVTEVDSADSRNVGLFVKNPTGLFFRSLADGGNRYEHPDNGPEGSPQGGTWHWPCGV